MTRLDINGFSCPNLFYRFNIMMIFLILNREGNRKPMKIYTLIGGHQFVLILFVYKPK